jgi:hypothetical protein
MVLKENLPSALQEALRQCLLLFMANCIFRMSMNKGDLTLLRCEEVNVARFTSSINNHISESKA